MVFRIILECDRHQQRQRSFGENHLESSFDWDRFLMGQLEELNLFSKTRWVVSTSGGAMICPVSCNFNCDSLNCDTFKLQRE